VWQIEVNLYADNDASCPPSGTGNATLLGQTTIPISLAQVGQIVTATFASPVNVPAGTALIAEVGTPINGCAIGTGIRFVPGGNTGTQTGPSYLRAPGCGFTNWTDFASFGFANLKTVMVLKTVVPNGNDQNGNGAPDECDSPDVPLVGDDVCVGGPGNNLPCSDNAECAGGFCGLKNRFISFIPGGGSSFGVKVTLFNLNPSSVANPSAYNGTVRWVGPPTLNVSDTPSSPFNAAALQCAFHAQTWPAGVLNVFGATVVPASAYDVQACVSATGPCSAPLRVSTAKWGDIIAPVLTVNFQDIQSIVDKFQFDATSPSKTRTKLFEPVNPNSNVNFQEVSADVAAFQGKPYKQVSPAVPPTCP